MKTTQQEWQLLESLVHDEEFDITYLSLELPDGKFFEATR